MNRSAPINALRRALGSVDADDAAESAIPSRIEPSLAGDEPVLATVTIVANDNPAATPVPGTVWPPAAVSSTPRGALRLAVMGLSATLLVLVLLLWLAWRYQLRSWPALPAPIVQALPSQSPTPSTGQFTASQSSSPTLAKGYEPEDQLQIDIAGNTSNDELKEKTQEQALAAVPAKGDDPSSESVRLIASRNQTPAALLQAWGDFQAGELAQAETRYRQILASEPDQRDALLGLAAIALQQGQLGRSAGIYQYLLQLNPQDDEVAATQLALESATNTAENNAAEANLLQAAQARPFLLGQYYAARQRWQEAQTQYFLAWSEQPDHPDLAYNLAISLDHLRQSALAAEFYQKALTLAAQRKAQFEPAAVRVRLARLQEDADGRTE
ncbi:lipopolysaccharide assembly protein LapB [Chitinibacter sp. GC72]|uniref:tetratricopeptide repeat protein n=1 Tax=Chitinibacter sp. GC72 TaxID=1526917 RepID=UPI0012F7A75D|nr:tetratricopeptide repeat protein [Chitinibacter sp. GC72]